MIEAGLPDKRNDIDRRRVVRVAQKVHEDIDDVGGDFGEFDGARVNALDEQLAVLEVLPVSALIPLSRWPDNRERPIPLSIPAPLSSTSDHMASVTLFNALLYTSFTAHTFRFPS